MKEAAVDEQRPHKRHEAWSVAGPNAPPPDHVSKWSLEHHWDISEVSQKMVKAFKEKYNLE